MNERLTDEEIDAIQEHAYRALRASGYNGGMGGETWDRASARAIESAVLARAAVPAPTADVDAWARARWPGHQLHDNGKDTPLMVLIRDVWRAARAAVSAVQPIADWQEDSNAHCREHDANALCATCGKTWGNHIGRCCDGDESSPRRFKLAAPPQGVSDLIEQLCSAAVAYGERADGEQAYYAAKAKLIEATCGVALPRADQQGYVDAFYEMAAKLGVEGAQAKSPQQVYAEQVKPALESLKQRAQNAEEGYLNMREWAEQNGLDTTARNGGVQPSDGGQKE